MLHTEDAMPNRRYIAPAVSDRVEIIRARDSAAWQQVLDLCSVYDFYHLADYHELAERRGEGEGYLFAYTDGPYAVALPLLLRGVSEVEGLQCAGAHWRDATSVYGYAGPVASHHALPEALLSEFWNVVTIALREMRVVSVFSRLHPLLPQSDILNGVGECATLGQSVAIDLTVSLEEQRAQYRKGHIEDVKKLKRAGMVCIHDREFRYLDAFIELYQNTMRRVGADRYYLFDRAYFDALRDALGDRLRLFVTLLGDAVTAAGLFVECRGIVQYHLSGTADGFLKMAPTKLLLDSVRVWAAEQGFRVFHLGGGVGSSRDSLFSFKAGFSHRRHEFGIWRWVLEPEVYKQLCSARSIWRSERNIPAPAGGYFPQYRA